MRSMARLSLQPSRSSLVASHADPGPGAWRLATGDPIPFPILPQSMSKVGTPETPLRVAVIGAGPSGFYACEHILRDEATHAQVDLFDRLPTPYGLVRGG